MNKKFNKKLNKFYDCVDGLIDIFEKSFKVMMCILIPIGFLSIGLICMINFFEVNQRWGIEEIILMIIGICSLGLGIYIGLFMVRIMLKNCLERDCLEEEN